MHKLPRPLTFVALLSVVASIIFLSVPGFAYGQPPMVVHGTVTLDGNSAHDGLNVTAWDRGVIVGSVLTSEGTYFLEVCGQVEQYCNQNDVIGFKLDINGTLSSANQTTPFTRGISVSLNLSFTFTSTPTPEYPNYSPIIIVAMLITVGAMAIPSRRNRVTRGKTRKRLRLTMKWEAPPNRV